ncbi:hypothetical protein [Deinococcus aquiradiocola]|uniref:Uncharacterized protein n=1 Tax=Deinococcus aquiradiocola TaxID=393059 RepID=A0A917UUQ6_9DEIO|nr:hypothetical protein [Deinococcus aquiradiocola]GGJ86537.1 hypothetical protein GCM10008939_33090 [Deinococcus aquiradiocola]
MRAFLILLTLLFSVAAVMLAALSLGSVASLNSAVPASLGALSAAEGLLSGRLHIPLDAFWRSLAWAGACCACVWLAAYLKPRP